MKIKNDLIFINIISLFKYEYSETTEINRFLAVTFRVLIDINVSKKETTHPFLHLLYFTA